MPCFAHSRCGFRSAPPARQIPAGLGCENWGKWWAIANHRDVASIAQHVVPALYGWPTQTNKSAPPHSSASPSGADRTGAWTIRRLAHDIIGGSSIHENRKPSIAAAARFRAAGCFGYRFSARPAARRLHRGGSRIAADGLCRRLVGVGACDRSRSARS